MASSQVASPQVEEEELELSNNAEEHTVMTPPAQNFDIDKQVHLIDDEDDIEIIPRRDQGKKAEDLDDATDEEEDFGVVKPAAQFDDDDDDEEPAGKVIRTRRFPDDDDE